MWSLIRRAVALHAQCRMNEVLFHSVWRKHRVKPPQFKTRSGSSVALTANAMRGERDICLAAGCVAYLSKPVEANVLIDLVEKLARTSDLASPGVSMRFDLDDGPLVGPIVDQLSSSHNRS